MSERERIRGLSAREREKEAKQSEFNEKKWIFMFLTIFDVFISNY